MEEKSLDNGEAILCCQRNQVNLLCCCRNCDKQALVCGKSGCLCISSNHPDCQFVYFESFLSKVKAKKQNPPESIRKAIQQINKIYQSVIEKISEDRESLKIWESNYGLSLNEIKFLSLIDLGKRQQISGRMISVLKDKYTKNSENVNEHYKWLTKEWVVNFWKVHQQEYLRVFQYLDKFSIEKHKLHENGKLIPSIILKNKQDIQNLFNKDIQKLRLLYRASQNDYSVEKFHEKADGVKDTIVIALTDSNKILGGYTPLRWEALNQRTYIPDQSMKSFVFNLKDGKKYELKNSSEAIQNHKHQGPTFGKVYSDLYISDQCNKCNKSIWNPGNTYCKISIKNTLEQEELMVDNEQINSMHVCLKQWQVFEIIFERNEQYAIDF